MGEPTYIGSVPAEVLKHWEEVGVRCARCGSSIEREACEVCDGEGLDGHDCGEDSCCCRDPEPNVRCDYCLGTGGWWCCVSETEWCEANPLPGRETVAGSTPEWFEIRAAGRAGAEDAGKEGGR